MFYNLILSWMKVFRITPLFGMMRLIFPQKVGLKMLNKGDCNRFSDLYSVYLKEIDHLNLKL